MVIPKGVTTLEQGLFSGCTGLTSVILHDGITSMGEGVFRNCTSLSSITISGNISTIEYDAFSGCTGLTSVTILDGVTTIGGSAFFGCTGLTSITLPDSVTCIEFGAFSACYNLSSITIPYRVTSIGNRAFHEYFDLTIYGRSGTVAESYATKNEIPFVSSQDDILLNANTGILTATAPNDSVNGAALLAEITSTKENEVTYNISFDKDGQAVQPDSPVVIRIPLLEGFDPEYSKVYRTESDGSKTDMNAGYCGGYLSFATDHFSEYTVAQEKPSFFFGDVNNDGSINASDALLALQHSVQLTKLEENTFTAADVDLNGTVDASDALGMLQYSVNLITCLPNGGVPVELLPPCLLQILTPSSSVKTQFPAAVCWNCSGDFCIFSKRPNELSS